MARSVRRLSATIGRMRLTVLGSGSSAPHPTRTSSGYWLDTGKGSILLDCPPSIISRLGAERPDWPSLDAIWISHFHLDHVGGLAPLLFGMKHAPEMSRRASALTIFGPAGLRRLIDAMDAAGNYRLLKQNFPVNIVEAAPLEHFEILPGVKAVAAKTPHTKESLAIHIDNGERTIAFTSDTGFDEALAAMAAGVDLFILECSFFNDKPLDTHLELREAMFLIRKAKPRLAMLTHFFPDWDTVDLANEIKSLDPPCDVIEAKDGSSITIGQ